MPGTLQSPSFVAVWGPKMQLGSPFCCWPEWIGVVCHPQRCGHRRAGLEVMMMRSPKSQRSLRNTQREGPGDLVRGLGSVKILGLKRHLGVHA